MDNRKSNQKTFENASKTFLNACGQIAIRMAEVKEFEKQWAQLFVPLVAKFGPDVKINIADKQLLRTFRYDKFHIICDDLLSLVQHQSQIEYSACRLAARELRVKTLKELLQEEESKHYVGAEVPPEFREFINRDIAERRLSHFRKKLVWLLGEDEDAGKREESIRARLGAVEDAVNAFNDRFDKPEQVLTRKRLLNQCINRYVF